MKAPFKFSALSIWVICVLMACKDHQEPGNIKGYTQTLYRYQYSAFGLPETRATLVKPLLDQSAVLSETIVFEYEAY